MSARLTPLYLLLLLTTIVVFAAPASATACYGNLSAVPATCSGGTIEQDVFEYSCRTVSCVDGTSGLMLRACEKPDEGAKSYFELYKVTEVGNETLEICLADKCLRSYGLSGFARSADYPICTGGGSDNGNETPGNETPGNDTNGVAKSVDLSIAPYYPQNATYVFVCTPAGFTPTSFDWYFGDETKLLNVSNDDVFHTFMAPGNYTVSCVAHTDGLTYTDGLAVTVAGVPPQPPANETCFASVTEMPISCEGGPLSNVLIEGSCIHAECNLPLSSLHVQACDKPDDGAKTHYEVYRTEASGSDPLELCVGETCLRNDDGRGFASSSAFPICFETLPVCGDGVINGDEECDTTAPPGFVCSQTCTLEQGVPPMVDLSIAPWYPQGGSYVFVCNAAGFTPTGYDWSFGDGQKLLDVANSNAFHTYEATGNYTVSCAAHVDGLSVSDDLNVTVGSLVPPPGPDQTCIHSVHEVPVTCTGGTLTTSDEGDCIHAECFAALDSLEVLACDKPDEGTKTGYEVYRQEASGSDTLEICFGDVCLRNDDLAGFAQSEGFPICSGEPADEQIEE